MPRSYLDRYLDGEYEQVCRELMAHGAAIRAEPLASDAQAVAHEIMQRARHNLSLIVPRLQSLGYQFRERRPPRQVDLSQLIDRAFAQVQQRFGDDPTLNIEQMRATVHNTAAQVLPGMMGAMREEMTRLLPGHPAVSSVPVSKESGWWQPTAQLQARVAAVNERYGPLPLTVQRWFEIVGEVDLRGDHPKLSRYEEQRPEEQQGPCGDPLLVACITNVIDIEDEILDAEETLGTRASPPYRFEVSNDVSQKCSAESDPDRVYVLIPQAGFDAALISVDHWNGVSFVQYLRESFRWGGFPGVGRADATRQQAQREIDWLTKDLLPI